jgi:thiol-disulfide isomerase/thioredoxin
MANPNPSSQGPRPLLALAAFAGAVAVGALSWYAWKITAEGSVAAPPPPQVARAPARQGPPPPPEIPYNQLVTAARPVPAPPIELPTADGKRFSLAAARGQVVVVNFWATWCPPCAKEMPSMVKLGEELARQYPGKFRMVAVSVDDAPGAVERFFAGAPYRGLPKDVVVALEPGAGDVTRGYYCSGRGACRPEDVKFPETYIVDREGRIVAIVVGDIDWSEAPTKKYLQSLITG